MTNMLLALVGRLQAARNEEDGQTLVEYGLILFLVSIAAIATMGFLGVRIDGVFNEVLTALGG